MTPPTTIRRKRVLFFVPAFQGGVGGAERVISTLLCHLDHSRFDCHLALVQSGRAYLADVPPTVTVHHLRVSRMRYALPAIIRLVWRVRPQTLLATVSYLNVLVMAARPLLPRGIRILLREATTPSGFIGKDTLHPALWTRLYRHFYLRAEKIICLSDSMMEDMAAHFAIPREKLARIYNPVDVNKLRRLAAAQSNPYQGEGPHLVAAGRLRREKGLDLLFDALPAVAQRFPGVSLAVLGEGPQESELKAQAARLGIERRVHFLGFQEFPWPYLAHADLFVLPSRLEGMPNALLESLALGTPVVASLSVGSILEIQESNPRMIVVPPEDPAALAQGIIAALASANDLPNASANDLPNASANDSANAGRASLEQSMEGLRKFDPESVAAQYVALF